MNIEKKIITEVIKGIDICMNDLDGPIKDMISRLQRIEKIACDKGYHNVGLSICNSYSEIEIEIYGDRPENDQEIKKRLLKSKRDEETKEKEKEQMEIQERQEYERLKAKFEKI